MTKKEKEEVLRYGTVTSEKNLNVVRYQGKLYMHVVAEGEDQVSQISYSFAKGILGEINFRHLVGYDNPAMEVCVKAIKNFVKVAEAGEGDFAKAYLEFKEVLKKYEL